MTMTTAADPDIRRGSGRGRDAGVYGATALLAVAAATSLLVGSEMVAPWHWWDSSGIGHAILLARLARTALAVAVGAALGVSGACLQGLTLNPLADPGLLGVNSGSACAMVAAVTFLHTSSLSQYLWFSLLGAATAALLVHALAAVGPGGATPAKLVLVGAAVTAALQSWTSGMLLVNRQTMDVFRRWEVGTVGGRGWGVILSGLPFLVSGLVLAMACARTLDALALGDDLARGLGRRVGLDRVLVGVASVLLAGGATALAGPIGFVGLIAPHLVRRTVGPGYARVLPLSALVGATLVVTADVVGRVVLPPTEVQVGIMTAVVGVPTLCWLLRGRGRVAR